MASRVDPYGGFRFRLQIEGLIAAGFSEISGLEASMEPEEYQEGGVNGYTHKLPTRFGYPNLTLKRGLTDSRELWEWLSDAIEGPRPELRRNVQVYLGDLTAPGTWGWEVHAAYPVKWSGPDLQADQGAVAIESVELAHHGITDIEV